LTLISFPVCAFKTALRLCKENHYDVIDTHFAVPSGPLGVAISKIKKIPLNLFLHGGDIYDPSKKHSPHKYAILRCTISYILKRSNRVIAQSSDTKNRVGMYYKCKRDIEIIHLPYDYVAFSENTREKLNLSESKKYLISVGRLVKRKDFGTLIKSLAELKKDNIEILLLGDGPELENLKRFTVQLGLEKRVHFLGFVSEEEKFQYLSVSDIYILSSLHEGFGIVLQEAMQVGLPIVATNYGGQTDLVEDGVNGFLVDVGNYKDIAKKVNVLLEDGSLVEKFREENISRIKQYSAKSVVHQILIGDSK